MSALSLNLARAVHSWITFLMPAATRRAYAADIRGAFDAMSAEASARGTGALIALMGRELSDAFRARRAARRDRTAPSSRPGRSWRVPGGSLRTLVRQPGYALVVILTLAFGGAITTTMFSLVETVLLRPLPYPDADRLVTVSEASPQAPGRPTLAAPGRIADWDRLNDSFSVISGSYTDSVTDTSGPENERIAARSVLPRFFDVFETRPLVGRTPVPSEEVAGGAKVVLISERFWERRFARDAGAIGRSLRLGGVSHEIIGVMSRDFAPPGTDAWLPAQIVPQLLQVRNARFVQGIGRLRTGISQEQGKADLDRVQRQLGTEFPGTDKGWTSVVADLRVARVGTAGSSLWMMFGAVTVVWVIGLVNVGSLVLVHVRRRAKELAIRSALGSSRSQIVAMVGQEVAVLAVVGCLVGLALAASMIAAVPAVFDTLPRTNELTLDLRSIAFAFGTCAIAALLCGIVPALTATKHTVTAHVTRSGRGTTRNDGSQRWLVAAQVALGVGLCASAALLAGSYVHLTRVDRGFDTRGVVTFHVGANWGEDRDVIGDVQRRLLDALEALPDVEAAGLVNFLPAPGGSLRYQVKVDGLPGTTGGYYTVGMRMVGGNYFKALGVRVTAGDDCGPLRQTRTPAALVNQRFIDLHADGRSIVGRNLEVQGIGGVPTPIVGVVSDMAEDGVEVARVPFVYTCAAAGGWPDPNYVVKTADASGFVGRLRSLVKEQDKTRAVFAVRNLEDVANGAIDGPRQQTGIMTVLALAALLLAVLGLYALFARLVNESRREIGVRLALGATPAGVIALVLQNAGKLLAAGLVVGSGLAFGAFEWLRASLHGDVTLLASSIAVAVVVLLTACLLAVVVPALRASRVDPTEALQSE